MAQGDKLDFKKALEIAQAMELADKHEREIAAPGTATSKPVHQVKVDSKSKSKKTQKTQNQTNSKPSCYRCGKSGHTPNKCWVRNIQCNKCHRTGHIAAVCHSKAKNPGEVNAVNQHHPLLFAQGLGELNGHKVSVAIEANAKPRFSKARPVPFAFLCSRSRILRPQDER